MMYGDFTFAVRHRAAPQGSKDLRTKANGAKYMKESSDRVKPFRVAIRRAACGADGRPMARFEGPVLIGIMFEFKRAQSNVDDYPTGRNIGDIDKLTRAVLDGLTEAEVIEDDSFVVGWLGTGEPSKLWGPEDRVIITVRKAPTARRGLTADFVVLNEAVNFGKLPPSIVRSTVPGLPPLAINPFGPKCCNSTDHKSCHLIGDPSACPCPQHCPEF